jgi:hypothetical protein
MIILKQVLSLGVLFAVVFSSAAHAEDCNRFQNSLTEYRDTSAALEREQARYDSTAPDVRDQERHALCRAVKNFAFSVISLKLLVSASCLADPSKYRETVDEIAGVLKNLANLQRSTCDAGE